MKTIAKQSRVETVFSVFPVWKWKSSEMFKSAEEFKFSSLPFFPSKRLFRCSLCVCSEQICLHTFPPPPSPLSRCFNFFSMKLNLLCSNSLIKERKIVFRNYFLLRGKCEFFFLLEITKFIFVA